MMKKFPAPQNPLTRRHFVQGLAAGGLLALAPKTLLGATTNKNVPERPAELRGKTIDLEVAALPVNFTGTARMAVAINGSIPAPTIRLKEGDDVTIRVTNKLSVPTSIHWHGILLPYQMDGVPGISFRGITPGETFTYRFTLRQSGTYWYHSHSGFQELMGMYGALIVKPREGELHQSEREHIIQLSDWTDQQPMEVYRRLKAHSDTYNYNQPTLPEFTADAANNGLGKALQKREMWNQMRMNPTDLADVSAAVMTFLMNGTTPNGNWTGLFKRGEKVRLRFINSSSNTFYDVRIPDMRLTIVAADGQNTEPVTVDEFRFGPGETYDAIVEPQNDAYTIFAQTMDRSGYARGTLATHQGLNPAVPALDPVEWLAMTDMMGNMMHHDGMDHSAMNHSGMDHSSMNHDMHTMSMDHSAHGHMQHNAHNALKKPSQTVNHARTEYGPSVDMRVDMPRTNLDDPGIGIRDLCEKGLRPAGHKVLTLADLHSCESVMLDERTPTRELELHLTGNMERYSWSFDGLEFGKSTPVTLKHNERVRIILQNDTMMTHPMHLHGMWSELEDEQGNLRVRRHTIPVQPAQRISYLTTPEDVGRWAWHCHLMFHMDSGMFREVIVA